jgi:hypothetical protein
MNDERLDEIVNAVLYEGHILYPYRPSSRKNQRERFTFGRVYPENYSATQAGAEPCLMQTECLVRNANDTEFPTVEVSVCFLHPMAREIGTLSAPPPENGATPAFKVVPELRVGNELFQTWHEAVERRINAPALTLDPLNCFRRRAAFTFPAAQTHEPIHDRAIQVAVIARRQAALEGMLELAAEPLDQGLTRITVQIRNHTVVPDAELTDTDAVLMRTFASVHTLLKVRSGEFISLMDPPAEHQSAAGCCRNVGTWPVLVGDEQQAERTTMLSSPIILYDYPKIAAESAGSMFDATEIDEILTLRIQTLTDEEKDAMRSTDDHARRLLEQTDALDQKAFSNLHGTMRKPEPGEPIEFDDFFGAHHRLEGISIDGTFLRPGDRVRLRPRARADVMDIALAGQTAVVEAVEQDIERHVHLAVVLEADPGKDLGLMRQPGHRFFYGIDEVEPLTKGGT